MKIKYNSWGGVREESKVIKYFADKWCKDNGYPIQKRKYVYRTLGRPRNENFPPALINQN
tara:strand:- start:204 stop:383 length:180 start_codon:yes stop_codon:yes gene_type:complete